MDQKSYTAAQLPEQLVNEIKSFEEKLREQSGVDVIVIAYEKGQEK